MEFLHRLLDKFDWAIAGLLGAVAGSFWHRDDLIDRKAWTVFLGTGAACAHYLTGMVSAWFGIVEPQSVAGVSFLLGAFGGSIIAAVTRALKSADLWELIKSRFGGGST